MQENAQVINWDELENPGKFKVNSEGHLKSKDPEDIKLYKLYQEHFGEITLSEPKVKSTIKGTVISKNDKFAQVDINWRESAYIDLSKEHQEYLKYIQVGYEIEVLIKTLSTRGDHPIQASYTEIVKEKKKQEILDSIETQDVAYMAKVTSLIYGGYFLEIDGIKVFMPGSQGGINKLIDFESLINKEIEVVPINYDSKQGYIVVSHREYLKKLVPSTAQELNTSDEISGFITGTTKFGIFVEFNRCLTGLIHKSDLDDSTLEKYNNGLLKPGFPVNAKIKEIVDPFRIVLSQKEIIIESSAWDDIDKKYKVPTTVNGKVKKIVRFGAFIELEPKVVGLLHKSDLEKNNVDLEVGEEIEVNLYKIDKEDKKLFFKI